MIALQHLKLSPLQRLTNVFRNSSCASQLAKCLDQSGNQMRHVSYSAMLRQVEPLPHPTNEGEAKTFPPKIEKIVDEISRLSLMEVAELNELLKIKLNISDVPMMAAAPAAAAGATEEGGEVVKEQTEFTVKLTAFKADSKVKLIKAIKTVIPDCNLVKAKAFVESLPQIVKRELSKEEAEELHKLLTEAGGESAIE